MAGWGELEGGEVSWPGQWGLDSFTHTPSPREQMEPHVNPACEYPRRVQHLPRVVEAKEAVPPHSF